MQAYQAQEEEPGVQPGQVVRGVIIMNQEAMQALIQRSRDILARSLQGSQAAALAAVIVPLGSLALSQGNQAMALTEIGPEYSSRVDSVITDQGNGVSRYEFTVVNTTDPYSGYQGGQFLIVNWELPSFTNPTSIIFNIQSPFGWDYEIIEGVNSSTQYYNNVEGPYGQYIWEYDSTQDPQVAANGGNNPYPLEFSAYDNPPFLIHWFTVTGSEIGPTAPIFPGDSLSGFSFDTLATSSDNSPYSSSWLFQPIRLGDPPVPGSNDTGISVPSNFVPEPTSLLLLAGLAGMTTLRRRRA